jgi:ATP-binding cassette, subfamily B, bacterial
VGEILGRFWPYTRGERHRLVLGAILAIIVSGGEIGTVILFEFITDKVLAQRHFGGFWSLAAAWLGVAAASAVAMFAGGYVTSLAKERFLLRLRDSMFAHTQQLSLDFFDRQRLGDLMIRLIDDLETIEGLVCSGLSGLAVSAVSVLLFAGAALVISWSLALLAFAVAPLFWLVSRGFSGRLADASDAERAASGAITSTVEESLSNQALVQAFNRQAYQSHRLHQEGVSWLGAKMTETRLNVLYSAVVYLIETLCVLIVFGAGAWQVAGHRISLGGMLALAILLTYIYPQVQTLSGYRASLAEGRASARRVTEILDFRPLVADGQAIRARVRGRGRIDVEDVSFTYPGTDRTILDGLSFTTEPGWVLAVVGPSGAGKSTIARLLLRFYDPSRGRILLDGIDIRELSLSTLRYNITLLQQDSQLFAGSVRDNIAYGARGATGTQIYAAARTAHAHEFITALPDGYDSHVGERGRMLSGGQRQRIAIARAILRDAPVLILDEPTTGLDPAGARRLLGLLGPVMAGRTTILITHDMALAAAAGDVLVIESRATAPPAAGFPARQDPLEPRPALRAQTATGPPHPA